jgi:hypothetical protein
MAPFYIDLPNQGRKLTAWLFSTNDTWPKTTTHHPPKISALHNS